MEWYLEDKYGKEFVVENYRVEGATLGIEGDPIADAFPKDDPSVRFTVWDRGQYRNNEHAYSDEYLGATWRKEEVENLATPLKQIIGYTPYYTLEVYTPVEIDQINSSKGLISFNEARKNSVNKSFIISV